LLGLILITKAGRAFLTAIQPLYNDANPGR
jgi:hypothetical protein